MIGQNNEKFTYMSTDIPQNVLVNQELTLSRNGLRLLWKIATRRVHMVEESDEILIQQLNIYFLINSYVSYRIFFKN